MGLGKLIVRFFNNPMVVQNSRVMTKIYLACSLFTALLIIQNHTTYGIHFTGLEKEGRQYELLGLLRQPTLDVDSRNQLSEYYTAFYPR